LKRNIVVKVSVNPKIDDYPVRLKNKPYKEYQDIEHHLKFSKALH